MSFQRQVLRAALEESRARGCLKPRLAKGGLQPKDAALDHLQEKEELPPMLT